MRRPVKVLQGRGRLIISETVTAAVDYRILIEEDFSNQRPDDVYVPAVKHICGGLSFLRHPPRSYPENAELVLENGQRVPVHMRGQWKFLVYEDITEEQH